MRDEEGMQTMRTLGNNMAWLLKCIKAGQGEGDHDTQGASPHQNQLHQVKIY